MKKFFQIVNKKTTKIFSRRMSSRKRFFNNSIKDYSGGDVAIPKEEIKCRILQIVNSIFENVSPSIQNADGGLYVGTAGISYALYYLSTTSLFDDKEKEGLIQKAFEYLKPSLKYTERSSRTSDKSSFILGNAGCYAIASVLNKVTGNESETKRYQNLYASAANNCKPLKFLRCGGDELFVGRAGYLCGAIWLSKLLNTEAVPFSDLIEISNTIVKSGRDYATKSCYPCLMYSYYDTEYLGAAHGLCAILQMLMTVPGYLEANESIVGDIKQSVDFFLSLQTNSGNFPCAMDEVSNPKRPESEELVHWCHGAPGVIYMLARAYIIWKDQKYLDSCIKCGELIWKKGLLKKGPGICHGVAGNGYVFLLLYRLTNDKKHLYRALAFANFMETEEFKNGARTPDSPFSLYEGLAGTACFLADLTQPDKSAFPFQDVF